MTNWAGCDYVPGQPAPTWLSRLIVLAYLSWLIVLAYLSWLIVLAYLSWL